MEENKRPKKKESMTIVERRFVAKLVEIMRQAVNFTLPNISNQHEQIWEIGIPYHGEFYGIDKFIESTVGDQNRQEALLRQAFAEKSISFILDAERKEDETPPKIIFKIHLQKRVVS